MRTNLGKLGVAPHIAELAINHARKGIEATRRGKLLPDDIQVWATIGVAAGTVICLDPQDFVSAFSAEPEIKVATQTLIHMDDTTPLAVGTPGTPPTVAAPLRSTFQTDTLAIELLLRAAWGWRVPVPGPPTSVAWLQNATWGG